MGMHGMTYLVLGGTGSRRCTTSAEALPDHPEAKLVYIRALPGNSGNVFVGLSTVTNTTGADNETCGYVLDAGQDSPPIPCPSGGLAQIYIIGSAADQDVTFAWYK